MRSLTIVLIIILMAVSSFAMPPSPKLLDRIRSREVPTPEFMTNPDFFKDKGIDQGKPHRLAALDHPTGQFKAIALFVRFTDHNSQVQPSYFDNLIYGSNGNTVKDFYSEVSYGNLDIITVDLPSTLGWELMPHTYSYYVDGNYGFGNYPQNAQKLTEDAVAAADPYVDFSQYDNDGDGIVDALYIIHTGPGAEWTGSVNDIWSHAWSTVITPYVDGVLVTDYSMEPEYWSSPGDMTCGVYCHELGHVFGLPDLYDYGYDSRGMGTWTVMSFGSWNGNAGDSPAHFDAWCRTFLGFADQINVTSNLTSVPFPAVEDTGVVYRLWTDGQPGSQYFLVENRQQIGFDSALPYNGLCVLHIDESVNGNDNQWYPGYTSNGHYEVALEQADGNWDLERQNNSGDSGDPYPGSTNNRTFNNTSTPDSKNYSFANTYVGVTNISNSSHTMTADLAISNAPTAPSLLLPANGSATSNRRPLFDFTDSPGATVYHIQIDDNADFSSPIYNINNLASSQYTPPSNLPEATLYWHVRAGSGSVWSGWTSAWTVIVDITAPAAPTNLLANGFNPSPWTNNSTFAINWTNPSDPGGILRGLFKVGSVPTSNFDTTGSLQSPPPRNVVMNAEGGVPMYLWLLDNAGNINYANRAQVTLNYDAARPANSVASSPDTTGNLSFRVSWSRGSDTGGSGISGMYDVWIRVDNGSWYMLYDNRSDTSAIYTGSHGHSYYFEALAIDNAGNTETRNSLAESNTRVDTTYRQNNFIPGDANNSGEVNGIDVVYLVNYLKGAGPAPDPLLAADANGNCVVNGIDVIYLVNYLKGTGPAPFMGNCP